MPHPYMGPTLRQNPQLYRELIQTLYHHHIIDFTTDPGEHCAIFFVKKKKNGMLRMVTDPRRFNSQCLPPPFMPIGGAACWSRLRIPHDKTLFVAQSDVEAYFFRMGIPEEIGRHFCLPQVPPAVVAASRGVDICETLGHGKWYPYFKVLPMGFSWSFFFAQRSGAVCLRQVLLDTTWWWLCLIVITLTT